MDLLEALYKKFGTTKEGLEKFLKHAKTLLDDGDITETELKDFLKENDIQSAYSKIEEEKPKPKKKVKSFSDLFDEDDDEFSPPTKKKKRIINPNTFSSSSGGCGSSGGSSSGGCGSSSSSSGGGCN
jgi:hypothetical protein